MMHLLLALLLAATSLVPMTGDAQIATPDPTNLPHARAPFGLGTCVPPERVTGIESIFAAMPDVVAEMPQSGWIERPDRTEVSYGTEIPAVGYPLTIAVISFARGDFFPRDFTSGDYVAMTLATNDAGAVAGGRDGDLAWVRAEIAVGIGDRPGTPTIVGTRYTLAWGEVDSGWMIVASADSPAHLEALVGAFVAVAGECIAPGATPAT